MSAPRPRVLVTATHYSRYCVSAKALLEQHGLEVVENPHDRPFTPAELADVVGTVDAVVAGVDRWDEAVLRLAPRLRVIARFGTGVDNIDLDAARAHGVVVTNARGGNANAVAEFTVGVVLALLRDVPRLDQVVRQGIWDRFMGSELRGRTVGLLGLGDIAQRVARKLSGFDVELLAFDAYPAEERARGLGVRLTTLQEVLAASDVVSLHLPSLPETRHLMDAARLAAMKPGAYLVNTARGALVDERALADALRSGHLAGAATDVYEQEPVTAGHPLFALDRVICTPHTAGETHETYETLGATTAQAVLDVLAGRRPLHQLVP